MKFKKLVVMLLAVQMILAGFAGCTKSGDGKETEAPETEVITSGE